MNDDLQLVEKEEIEPKNSYPLYDTFSQHLTGEISLEELEIIKEYTASFTKEQSEAFYMLIVEHARKNDVFDTTSLPYGIIYTNKKLSIELRELPVELQEILYKFILVISEQKEVNL